MLRVLIADDESKVCQLIEKLVDWDALGMEVVAVAENGIEALEKIKEFHPDIVITDIRMPGYDGLDLIRLGKEEAPKAEFVIISGYRHFEYAQMAIRYGVNAYLLKPIKKDELTETLKRLSTRFRVQTEQLSQEEKTRLAIRSDEKNLRQAFLQDLVGRRNKETLSQPLLDPAITAAEFLTPCGRFPPDGISEVSGLTRRLLAFLRSVSTCPSSGI